MDSSAAAAEPQGVVLANETAGNVRWPNRDQVAVLMTQSPPLVPHFTLVRFTVKADLKPGEVYLHLLLELSGVLMRKARR